MIIDQDRVDLWPPDLIDFLDKNYPLFLAWEKGGPNRDPQAYDDAIRALAEILSRHILTGWHCARLTDSEISNIVSNGLALPDRAMLEARIDARVAEGALDASIAELLKAENQADESNRKGRVWFCFFTPRIGEESGISRLFRSWGGEALYNSHEGNEITGPVLEAIGSPCLIQADVPISDMRGKIGLCFKIIRRYLISRGLQSNEPVDHEDATTELIPATSIRRIVRVDDADFVALTGCDTWRWRVK